MKDAKVTWYKYTNIKLVRKWSVNKDASDNSCLTADNANILYCLFHATRRTTTPNLLLYTGLRSAQL